MKNKILGRNDFFALSIFRKMILVLFLMMKGFVFNSNAQDSTDKARLSQLLQSYYDVKDALVNGKSADASNGAKDFIKSLNGLSYKIISEGNVNVLLKDAGAIADAKDINKQRQYFSNFSNNMYEVAKFLKLTGEPVYRQYCPMKKMYWLSNEKAIKNPYYGKSMLTCGNVAETIQ